MRTISEPRKRLLPGGDQLEHALVETDEHEIVDLSGCSEDEVKAKLHDLLAWAS